MDLTKYERGCSVLDEFDQFHLQQVGWIERKLVKEEEPKAAQFVYDVLAHGLVKSYKSAGAVSEAPPSRPRHAFEPCQGLDSYALLVERGKQALPNPVKFYL